MKLSDYAKSVGLSYRTAHKHWKQGLIQGYQLPTGTIVVCVPVVSSATSGQKVVLYARVSSAENKDNLESQLNRLRDYASAKGYEIVKEVKEVGSGLNDKRPLLEKVLKMEGWDILLVEHKDRFSRFGTNYITILLEKLGKQLEIINNVLEDKEDLMQDFVSVITSFCAKLYGLRRSKRKTEKLIEALEKDKTECN